MPVLSSVTLYLIGFSSTTLSTASTVASSWPLRRSTVVCFEGLSLATRRLRAISLTLGALPGASDGTLARTLASLKMLVALDDDAADLRLDDLEADLAALELLLGQDHLHRAVARVAVGALHRLERPLHVGERAPGAGERLRGLLELRGAHQRRAVEDEAADLEARPVVGRRRLGGWAGACASASEHAASRQRENQMQKPLPRNGQLSLTTAGAARLLVYNFAFNFPV